MYVVKYCAALSSNSNSAHWLCTSQISCPVKHRYLIDIRISLKQKCVILLVIADRSNSYKLDIRLEADHHDLIKGDN